MTDRIEARLKRVEDRFAIHDVMMRYCRGADRGDPDMIHSAFHDDATDNHYGITLPYREALGSLKNPPDGPLVAHNLANELVEIEGDVAHSESYFFMVCRLDQGEVPVDWLLSGRYIDVLERRSGQWRIVQRTTVYDWQRFEPVGDCPGSEVYAKFTEHAAKGSRGTSDWSYRETPAFSTGSQP